MLIVIYPFVESPARGLHPQRHHQFVRAVLCHLLIKGNIQMNSIILGSTDNVRLDFQVLDMTVGLGY
jgi:hypothetical protein